LSSSKVYIGLVNYQCYNSSTGQVYLVPFSYQLPVVDVAARALEPRLASVRP
jgi:hypothetical protein